MNAKHTATPWQSYKDTQYGWMIKHNEKDLEYSKENVKHIVHCVNTHDELINALDEIAYTLTHQNDETVRINNEAVLHMVYELLQRENKESKPFGITKLEKE